MKRNHQIGESELVYRSFSGKTPEGLSFETQQCPGRLSHVDRIDDKQPPHTRDMRKQRQTLRTAVEENDIGRYARVPLEPVDGMNTDSIVRVNKISQTEDNRLSQ